MSDFDESIIDATKPNAGRIYDYFIEGNYHFEIDVQMAKQLEKQAPFIPKLAKLTRQFLREGIHKALELKFTQFLDFASGLPIYDHIHRTAPEGTKVIYSDIDPITVTTGRKIIGDNPIVKYETCNAATPEILLNSDIVKKIFGDNHKVAIGFNGICWFLKDEEIHHAMKVLYEWAEKDSILFFTDADMDTVTEDLQKILDLYKNMKQPTGNIHTKKDFTEFIKPWKIEEPGLLPLEEWIGLSPLVLDETIKSWGGGGLYGGFLKK